MKINTTYFKLKGLHIYGSSRVGVRNSDLDVLPLPDKDFSMTTVHYSIGSRTYELSNHLRNVLSVISDKVIPKFSSSTVISEMRADIRVAQDYSPFGVTLDGRNYVVDEGYRYGFQNQEEDPETGLVNYKYRMHDPRLGRFFAIDPLAAKYVWNSPYAFSENRVIDGVELEGLEYENMTNLGQVNRTQEWGSITNTFDFTGGGKGTDYITVTTSKEEVNQTKFQDKATGKVFYHDNYKIVSVTTTKIQVDKSGKVISAYSSVTHHITTYPAPGEDKIPTTTTTSGEAKTGFENMNTEAKEYTNFVIKSKTTGDKESPVQSKADGNDDFNTGVTRGGTVFAMASVAEALAVSAKYLSKSRLGGWVGLAVGVASSAASEAAREDDPTKITLKQNIGVAKSKKFIPNK